MKIIEDHYEHRRGFELKDTQTPGGSDSKINPMFPSDTSFMRPELHYHKKAWDASVNNKRGECMHCGQETYPIVLCKCPERQSDGSWVNNKNAHKDIKEKMEKNYDDFDWVEYIDGMLKEAISFGQSIERERVKKVFNNLKEKWREEFDKKFGLLCIYLGNDTPLSEPRYEREVNKMIKTFISSLLSSQARALKEKMKVEIVTILDKDWKPADNLVGIIQMELLSAIESIEI